MMLEKETLKVFAKEAGADVFGVANVERFDELPLEKHPRSIFPETRSVIVLGRRITRGTLRGVEEGTNFENYDTYGCNWLDNRFIALLTFRVAEYIEDRCWEAVPLQNLPPEIPSMGVAVRKDQPAPNVMLDLEDAAVRAGLGEIGYWGVLVTPEFGPRQRIQMILTDAEISPDPIVEKPICPASDQIKKSCPLGAYVGEKEIIICGKKMTIAEIDYSKCSKCKNGARGNPYHSSGKPDRLAALCTRNCIDYLEKNKLVGNKFNLPFRIRNQWVVEKNIDFFKR